MPPHLLPFSCLLIKFSTSSFKHSSSSALNFLCCFIVNTLPAYGCDCHRQRCHCKIVVFVVVLVVLVSVLLADAGTGPDAYLILSKMVTGENGKEGKEN